MPDSQSSAPYTVIILAGVLGSLLSGGVAFLIEYLNDTLRSTDNVTRRLCLPSLGSIKPNCEGAGRVPDLMVLPSRLPSSDPLGLLSSRRLQDLLHELAKQAEVIITDGPPILLAADAVILASKVNGILLVLDAGRTTTSTASEALESLGMDACCFSTHSVV